MVATQMAMLHQVGLGSCIALWKLQAKYSNAKDIDGDQFYLRDQVKLLSLLLCTHVAVCRYFSLSLKLFPMNYRGGCLDQFCRLSVYSTDIYYVARNPYNMVCHTEGPHTPGKMVSHTWDFHSGDPHSSGKMGRSGPYYGNMGTRVPIFLEKWGPVFPFSQEHAWSTASHFRGHHFYMTLAFPSLVHSSFFCMWREKIIWMVNGLFCFRSKRH